MARRKRNNNSCSEGEKKITCRNRNCGKKFRVKIGNKNNGYSYNRIMRCPHCGIDNVFRVKAHNPAT